MNLPWKSVKDFPLPHGDDDGKRFLIFYEDRSISVEFFPSRVQSQGVSADEYFATHWCELTSPHAIEPMAEQFNASTSINEEWAKSSCEKILDHEALRDKFAMAALPQIMGWYAEKDIGTTADMAKDAFLFADEMMKARKKGGVR